MQLIAEAYALLKNGLAARSRDDAPRIRRMEPRRTEQLPDRNHRPDRPFQGPKTEAICSTASSTWPGQKGTGKWSVVTAALDENDPLTLITEAVYARHALVAERSAGSRRAGSIRTRVPTSIAMTGREPDDEKAGQAEAIRDALYAAKLVSYAQGFSLMRRAVGPLPTGDLDYGTIARIWRKGCIIRSAFLEKDHRSLTDRIPMLRKPACSTIFSGTRSPTDAARMAQRRGAAVALGVHVALPCMSSALSYFDGLRTRRFAGQSDPGAARLFRGAHASRRTDAPTTGTFFHNDWTGRGGNTIVGQLQRMSTRHYETKRITNYWSSSGHRAT